jgi:uncharacterized protein (TIGR00255 family)
MVRSMTGFGSSEHQGSNFRTKVEIKSLNGKFLEFNMRSPKLLSNKELELRKLFSSRLKRGSVQFYIYIEQNPENVQPQRMNGALAAKYYAEIAQFADSVQAPQQDILRTVLLMPEVFKMDEAELSDEDWKEIAQTAETAYLSFDQFRLKEGAEIGEHLNQHVHRIGKILLPEAIQIDEVRIEKQKDRLRTKFKEWGQELNMDENRFEQEVLYYTEKIDISEEKNRLSAHLEHFVSEMGKSEVSGKKLGFICQEIGREINTMGSKANDAELQKVVIQMKDELEKMKEQILNVL